MTRAVGVTLLLAAAFVPPVTPASHPIKGYASGQDGQRVYFVPDDRWYEEASPERCYASEADARADGARPARAPSTPAPPPV